MNFGLRIILMLLLVLALSILPLPHLLASIRPSWVLFFVLYIQFFLPHYFSIWVIVFLGFCLDVLLSTSLGNHGFALVLTTWIGSSRVRHFHILPLAQQLMTFSVLCLIYQFTLYAIDLYQGFSHTLVMMLGTTLVSIVLWPWVSMIFEKWFNLSNRQRMNFL